MLSYYDILSTAIAPRSAWSKTASVPQCHTGDGDNHQDEEEVGQIVGDAAHAVEERLTDPEEHLSGVVLSCRELTENEQENR